MSNPQENSIVILLPPLFPKRRCESWKCPPKCTSICSSLFQRLWPSNREEEGHTSSTQKNPRAVYLTECWYQNPFASHWCVKLLLAGWRAQGILMMVLLSKSRFIFFILLHYWKVWEKEKKILPRLQKKKKSRSTLTTKLKIRDVRYDNMI